MSNELLINSLQPPPEQNGIIFRTNNTKCVLRITHDGRLEKGEGYSNEEAAQLMFDAVSDHLRGIWKKVKDENAALRREIKEIVECDEAEAAIAAQTIADLKQESVALKQALDAQMKYQRHLREDRDRLDWLETLDCDSHWWVHIADSTNLRATIDNARLNNLT